MLSGSSYRMLGHLEVHLRSLRSGVATLPCISLDTLESIPRVWPLSTGFQKPTHRSGGRGICAALRYGAGRDDHKCNCRSLLSSAGGTSAEYVKCCGKEHWQGRVGAGRKARAGGVFQILYFKKIPS